MAQDPTQNNQTSPNADQAHDLATLEEENARLRAEFAKLSGEQAADAPKPVVDASTTDSPAQPKVEPVAPTQNETKASVDGVNAPVKKASPEGANLAELKRQINQPVGGTPNAPEPPDPFDVQGAEPTTTNSAPNAKPPTQTKSVNQPGAVDGVATKPSAATVPMQPKPNQGSDVPPTPAPVPPANSAPPVPTPVDPPTTTQPPSPTPPAAPAVVHRPNPLAPLATPTAEGTAPAAPQAAGSAGQAFFDTVAWNARTNQAQAEVPPATVPQTQVPTPPMENYTGSDNTGVTFDQAPTPDMDEPAPQPTPARPAPTPAPTPQAARTAPTQTQPAAAPAGPSTSLTPASERGPQSPQPTSADTQDATTPEIKRTNVIPPDQTGVSGISATPKPSTPEPKTPSSLRPMRTFKGDIESTVQSKQTSVVDIVSAEQERQSAEQKVKEAPKAEPTEGALPRDLGTYLKIALSGIFVGVTLAALVGLYFLLNTGPTNIPVESIPEYVFAESNTPVDVTGLERRDIMLELARAKNNSELRIGAINNLYLTNTEEMEDGGTRVRLVTAEEFLTRIEAQAPQPLVRSLDDIMMFGAHIFDSNQPFIIFKTTHFENAFAGMLQWESDINADLAPLFGPVQVALPTVNQTGAATSTTDDFFAQPFQDEVINNKEARVLYGEEGGIALVYGFLDRKTIVITTSEETFREIVTRNSSRRF